MAMRLITKMCKQKAVYWGSPTPDGYGGKTFASPVELSVRWQDVNNVAVTPEGEQFISRATVFVLQDVDLGGFLRLGEMDSDEPSSPIGVSGAYPIRAFNKTPTLKATQFVRTALI